MMLTPPCRQSRHCRCRQKGVGQIAAIERIIAAVAVQGVGRIGIADNGVVAGAAQNYFEIIQRCQYRHCYPRPCPPPRRSAGWSDCWSGRVIDDIDAARAAIQGVIGGAAGNGVIARPTDQRAAETGVAPTVAGRDIYARTSLPNVGQSRDKQRAKVEFRQRSPALGSALWP